MKLYIVCTQPGGDLGYEHLYGSVDERIHAMRDTAEQAAARIQQCYDDAGWDRTAWVEPLEDLDELSPEEREYAETVVPF